MRGISGVRRAIVGLAAAGVIAAGLVGITPVAASAAPACSIQPYGAIGERWTQLGGRSTFGCPITGELDIYRNGNWFGRVQHFGGGDIVWMQHVASATIAAAWESGGYAIVDWRGAIRSYGKFLVRWSSASGTVQRDAYGGTGGRYAVRVDNTGAYTFSVKGCDTDFWGSHCADWTYAIHTLP